MRTCDEATAKFMGQSLTKHARAIHNYALAYCAPTRDNDYIDEESRLGFARNLERMLKEMYALMLMAKYKGVNRFCNTEQIEAYMDAAAEVIAAPADSTLHQGSLN